MEHLNLVLGYVYILLGVIIICYLISCFLRTDRCVPCFCFVCLITAIPFFFDDRIGFLIYVLFVSALYIVLEIVWVRTRILRLLQNLRFIFILSLTILVGYIVARLMVHKFNNDSWWINENNISDSIDKWGDFATFFGGIFALISIFLAYKAFMSQANASKRTSFDTTFTQIFAQHHILHAKVVQHTIGRRLRYSGTTPTCNSSNTIFSVCMYEYIASGICGIGNFWEDFNDDIGNEASIDFKNYFKYIYHEINIVVSQPDEVLNDNAKRNYIQLIQAQMNYDELFCYFINQVEYLNYWRTHSTINEATYNEAITHAENLLEYGFFYELCKSRSGHVNLVRDISRYNNEEVSRLIDVNWIS